MIQLAVSTYSLARWRKERNKNLVQSLRWLADNDVKGVEFVGVDEADPAKVVRKARSLRRECDKLGLHICGYCTPGELLRDPGEQQQMVEQLKRQVDVAAMLGVKSMRHDVTGGDFTKVKGYKGPTTFAAALKILVPAIREVADYAATQGLKTSLENHGFYMQAPDRVEKLLQTVDHPAFGLTIDMGNFMCVNADPVAAVRQLLPYAIHAHVKDFHIRPKKTMPPSGWFATPTPIALRGAIVGHGAIDIPAQLKLLKRAKYAGWLSLEFEGMEDPELGVREGLKFLRRELA